LLAATAVPQNHNKTALQNGGESAAAEFRSKQQKSAVIGRKTAANQRPQQIAA
jgi:hypothetical protein